MTEATPEPDPEAVSVHIPMPFTMYECYTQLNDFLFGTVSFVFINDAFSMVFSLCVCVCVCVRACKIPLVLLVF